MGLCVALTPRVGAAEEEGPKLQIQDAGKIYSAYVTKTVQPSSVEEMKAALLEARQKHLKISIAGKRHSQGGHTFYPNAIVLDMRGFKKILNFNPKEKLITVQSGITWREIQEFINPYGLAVKVMQSSNIFTVGGSLSSNIHGRDPREGPVIETVRAFRLLQADGSVIPVSRKENEELFRLAIGGYGLFGVILEVDLELTDNEVYEKEVKAMDYTEYPEYLIRRIRKNPEAGIHFARLSFAPKTLLKDAYAVTYRKSAGRPEGVFTLQGRDRKAPLDRLTGTFRKLIFDASRRYDWAKDLRWDLQKKFADLPHERILSRNNIMNPPLEVLEHDSPADADILQEYYVPLPEFVAFVDGCRKIVKDHGVNLLSVTLRYVPRNDEARLSYSGQEAAAIVFYVNQELSGEGIRKAGQWTQELADLVLRHHGTYYLTYQLYPGAGQLRRAYPEIDEFFRQKKFYDPEELFFNEFYEKYGTRQ